MQALPQHIRTDADRGWRFATLVERRAKPALPPYDYALHFGEAYKRFFQRRGMNPPTVSSHQLDFAVDWKWGHEAQAARLQSKSARTFNYD